MLDIKKPVRRPEAIGFLKIDALALGMVSVFRRMLDFFSEQCSYRFEMARNLDTVIHHLG
jgi:DNA polymerase III alpha subunit